ncbi:uncharacterized protein OCT59_014606 [Rhizophagus irregularis]|uniref:uncharacterized protein n=1 Tax=Rhizophagus irregularis TaxID=588596 RepID=UPI0033290841|nr:hypothetical protein OCT59_014606 [Rhizophagus irregularis]
MKLNKKTFKLTKISFKLDTGIPQEISFKIWISDFHELAPIWDTNPTRNRLQHGRQNLLGQVSDEFNIGILKVQNTKEIGSELANPIGKEIGSELANPIEKSAPIWIPESYREISSNLLSYRKIISNL